MKLINQEMDLGIALTTFTFADPDGRLLEVRVTDEGVIMDAYTNDGDTWVDSVGRMADEWFEYVEGSGS